MENMFRSAFVLSFLGALAAAQAPQPIAASSLPICCGPDEHYESNSNRCQITCANKHLEPIMGPCIPTSTCFCNNGYVRDSKGVCILREKCPPICNPNEHFETNSHRCQISCDIMHLEPVMGPCDVSSACFCDQGYVRSNQNGVCIKRENCPPRCGPFERYLNNTVQCQITCKTMPLEPYMGPCYPTSGCFCIPGYVRNECGICIRREDCPTPPCKINEVYLKCGTACPETCQNRGNNCTLCTMQCVEGCFCREGYVRADDGSCVLPKHCPPRTCSDPNEVFVKCPPVCPPGDNCSNMWTRYNCSKFVQCCRPGCRCKNGYLRNKQGKCITTDQCIQTGGYRSSATAESISGYGSATATATATANKEDIELCCGVSNGE